MNTELKLPRVGDRVEILKDWWFDGPNGVVPAGSRGVVSYVGTRKCDSNIFSDETIINVFLDNVIIGLEDNILSFYPECGLEKNDSGHEMNVLEQFHYYCMPRINMTIDELKKKMLAAKVKYEDDTELLHGRLDFLLLEYIDDPEVTKIFAGVEKWYA